MSDETEILATLQTYADTYCAKDIDGLMALFIDSDDISVIGTGASELCAGQEPIRALFANNFAEATATSFDWHWQKVTQAGDAAIVATTLTINLILDGDAISVPIRWTVGLVKQDGQWRWLHRHASSAAGGQSDGAAYPTNERTSHAL